MYYMMSVSYLTRKGNSNALSIKILKKNIEFVTKKGMLPRPCNVTTSVVTSCAYDIQGHTHMGVATELHVNS